MVHGKIVSLDAFLDMKSNKTSQCMRKNPIESKLIGALAELTYSSEVLEERSCAVMDLSVEELEYALSNFGNIFDKVFGEEANKTRIIQQAMLNVKSSEASVPAARRVL